MSSKLAPGTLHAFPTPRLNAQTLADYSDRVLIDRERVEVLGSRNALELIQRFVRKGFVRLEIPGVNPDVFRFPEQVSEKTALIPGLPLTDLNEGLFLPPKDLVVFGSVGENLAVPDMSQDAYIFKMKPLSGSAEQGWYVDREELARTYAWYFARFQAAPGTVN